MIEEMVKAAQKRIADFVARSAGQHSRAITKAFKELSK